MSIARELIEQVVNASRARSLHEGKYDVMMYLKDLGVPTTAYQISRHPDGWKVNFKDSQQADSVWIDMHYQGYGNRLSKYAVVFTD